MCIEISIHRIVWCVLRISFYTWTNHVYWNFNTQDLFMCREKVSIHTVLARQGAPDLRANPGMACEFIHRICSCVVIISFYTWSNLVYWNFDTQDLLMCRYQFSIHMICWCVLKVQYAGFVDVYLEFLSTHGNIMCIGLIHGDPGTDSSNLTS